MVGYQNSKNRLNYGFVAQRIPYVYGDYAYGYQGDTYIEQEILYRQIYYEIGGFASYPLSQMQRVEFSGGYDYIQFNNVVYTSYYDLYGNPLLIDDPSDLPSPAGLHMAYVSAALVYDSSLNGATAPIIGESYRLEISPTVGSLNYYSILADYRKYIMPVRPFTLALRVMHYGRYGKGSDDNRLYPMFLGYDWNIRGYDYNSFTAEEVDTANGGFDLNRLFGSRMMIANFELRFPLFGAFGIGRGYYGIFPVDFLAFYDMGLAWDSLNKPWFMSGGDRKLLRSAGVGLRVNLLGYVVLGVNYVYPFDRPTKGWYWQFSFFPGF
jgi:outer membrane protein assembly factor BamA